jgi:hypothetical protein
MAFDLYFAGAGDKPVIDFKFENSTNQLLSQLNERSSIINWIENMKNSNKKCKLFIDSGAWSAHSKGKEVNIDDYIKYLNLYDEYFYIYAELDKIPGEFRKPKTVEQKLEAPEISWKNYLYMKDKVKSRDKLLPVFHQGEDYKWLKNMLEYKHEDTGKSIPYIGISPANDSSISGKIAFIDKCFDIIKNSSNPNVKTHAFGMTSLDILEQYPFTSADSTSYLMSAINGNIMTKYGCLNVSERRLSKDNMRFLKDKDLLDSVVNKYGFTLDELASDVSKRTIYNIKYLLDWCNNYVYKPAKIKQKKLFEI